MVEPGQNLNAFEISCLSLKGKDHTNTNEFYLKVFGKRHILTQSAWKSDSYL